VEFEFDFPCVRYSNLSKRDHDTESGVESPVFREVETNVATRKPRSVNERRQGLRDCMTVSGRITHGGVPVPFTQGNPRAVKWVRDRTDYRLNKTLNERKVVLSQNRVTIYSFPSVTTLARGLK
jgi:hypothetical protein